LEGAVSQAQNRFWRENGRQTFHNKVVLFYGIEANGVTVENSTQGAPYSIADPEILIMVQIQPV
jgi:hypothetical protein